MAYLKTPRKAYPRETAFWHKFDSQSDWLQEYEALDAKAAADQAKAKRMEEAKSEHEKLLAERKLLPIYPYREQLLDAVAAYQVVVIVGETGSGKTTQVCLQGLMRAAHAYKLQKLG